MFTKVDYKNLSDKDLEREIDWVQRRAHHAWEARRKASGHGSEAGLLTLDEEVAYADSYLKGLLAEREMRGRTKPSVPEPAVPRKTVTKLANTPAVPKPTTPKPVHPSYPVEDDDARPPIILMDKGKPRAWRPGDPIY